jgi:hypothetical protein
VTSQKLQVGDKVRFDFGGKKLTGEIVAFSLSGRPMIRRQIWSKEGMKLKHMFGENVEKLNMRLIHSREDSDMPTDE